MTLLDYPGEPSGDGGEPSKRRRPSRRLLAGFAGSLLLLGGLYVAGYFVTGLRMPANVTVAGVDVSAMSTSAAKARLDEQLTPRADEPIELSYGTEVIEVDPVEAGLQFDLDATIAAAGGERSWNPADMWALAFGEHTFGVELDVDESKLQTTVETLAATIDEPAVEPQITFAKGEPVIRKPADGRVVDRDKTTEAISDAFLIESGVVAIPTIVDEPAVGQDGLDQAIAEFAKPAMSGPVLITSGDDEAKLPTSAFDSALIVSVKDGELTPAIDPKKLAEPLQDTATGLGKKARDATIEIKNGEPVIEPSRPGLGLQPEELATKLVPVLSKTGEDRTLTIKAKVVEPEFTTKDAKALGITEKVSSFTTRYAPAAYRDINQGRAAELINGTIVEPGETFSFNETVGERTRANGFTSGTIIKGGVFREELGGGVSQVVTTTYNAAFFAGMTDIEHHPHAFYISRYPVGREATVYWGSLDMRFRNDTDYGVLIRAYISPSSPGREGTMTVELWSTKVWEIKAGLSAKRNFREPGVRYDPTSRCIPQSPVRGFDIDVYRTFYKDGKKIKTETDTAFYKAADEVRCREKPDSEDKKNDSATE